ncbi:hypothetical protein C7974DRAFT_383731 [Boeremia exigua]|uniref:uncharacterized protein n=1 Tax=Boeremia exigua TaxID=749465 RepID=UPI001E8DCC9A|nr:uncharacterized protein C7974DRAFT_383731 [Boeremia exigua]KAH6644531.1 hypothetical protein C7974DRAFT_383731 [Boeremia exigua]
MSGKALIVPQVDWATTGTAIERRRRQNRINQRAQRERLRISKGKPSISPPSEDPCKDRANEALLARLASAHCFKDIQIIGPNANTSIQLLSLLENAARTAYNARSPRTDILLGLTQLNVYRALVVNIEVLGLTASEMHDDALSPFSIPYTYHPQRDGLPAPLQPTHIQRSVPHHPWLDLLPDATLRNNMILLDAAGLLDDAQCCLDMCSRGGIVVWTDPWDPSGWEVTPEFLRKWRVMLAGCWELFRATNRWREKRGEKGIAWATWAGASNELGG